MSTANDDCIQRPYSSTADTSTDRERWFVDVPAVDYIRQAFFGAIATLGFPDSYNPISDTAAEYGSEIVASLTQIVPPEEVGVPSSLTQIYQMFAIVSAGNAFTKGASTAQMLNSIVFQSAAAVNDAWYFPRIALKAGTYDYRLLHVRNTASGILELFLVEDDGAGDDYQIGGPGNQIDLYNNPAVNNQIYSSTVTLPKDSIYRLLGYVTGKRVASSGYNCVLTMHEFQRQ